MADEPDMVERVARAMWDAGEVLPWDAADEIDKGMFLKGARASIEAMREPTMEMWEAGR